MATKKAAPRTLKKPARARPAATKKREAAFRALDQLLQAHPGLVLEGDERATFTRACPDLEALQRAHRADGELLFRCAWAYRKMGRFEDALRAADLALAASRSWRTLTAKATVYRATKDVERAIELFHEAAELDPEDTTALMEGARTLGEAGRFAEAAAWFARVLERSPAHREARLWHEYSSFLATGGRVHVENVRALAQSDPSNELARRILADMRG